MYAIHLTVYGNNHTIRPRISWTQHQLEICFKNHIKFWIDRGISSWSSETSRTHWNPNPKFRKAESHWPWSPIWGRLTSRMSHKNIIAAGGSAWLGHLRKNGSCCLWPLINMSTSFSWSIDFCCQVVIEYGKHLMNYVIYISKKHIIQTGRPYWGNPFSRPWNATN